MKKYYSTLSKEQKSKIKEQYKKEYKNTELQIRLVRLLISGCMGYVTSIVLLIDAFLSKSSIALNITIAVILLIISTIFLIGRLLIKQKVLNKIALKHK